MLRAPKREPRPVYEDAHHVVHGHWEPGRFWRVLDHDGKVWMETSNKAEAVNEAREKGYDLQRQRRFVLATDHWADEEYEDNE